MTEGVLEKLIDRGNRWLGGDTGWDVHYALFAREFGQVRESAGQEPGFYFFKPEDILDPLAESDCGSIAVSAAGSEPP